MLIHCYMQKIHLKIRRQNDCKCYVENTVRTVRKFKSVLRNINISIKWHIYVFLCVFSYKYKWDLKSHVTGHKCLYPWILRSILAISTVQRERWNDYKIILNLWQKCYPKMWWFSFSWIRKQKDMIQWKLFLERTKETQEFSTSQIALSLGSKNLNIKCLKASNIHG